MADDLDRAQQESELMLSIQLRQRKSALAATGCCHWCEGALQSDTGHFCNADCRDDFEMYRRRNGGF